jgi:NhaP-type Na+/H+ or K+/H+ antiporter
MFPAAWLPRKLVPGLAKRDPMPTFGELVVLGWTGMRGIVSLAAALALPATLANGEPFVERPLIIFLAYAVTLLTLIVPTVTLPFLLRYFGICEHNVRLAEEVRARISMSAAATEFLQRQHGQGKYTDELLDDLERRYDGQLGRLRPNLDLNASSLLDPSEQQKRKLMLEVLESERGTLHQLRSRDELYDEYFHQLSDELDLETLRVRRNMRPL